MTEIGIGIVGGGYMGKAHAVAMRAVAALFDTKLRPRLEMVAATRPETAETYRATYGFLRATDDWRVLVNDPAVEAVIIATPQDSHRDIAEAAISLGKPVLCEKPLADSLEDARAMVAAADHASTESIERNGRRAAGDLPEEERRPGVPILPEEKTKTALGGPPPAPAPLDAPRRPAADGGGREPLPPCEPPGRPPGALPGR